MTYLIDIRCTSLHCGKNSLVLPSLLQTNHFYHIPLEPWIVTVRRWGMDFTIAWKLRSTFDCPSITLCEKIEVIIETWLKKAKTALNLRRTKRWKGLPTMNISINVGSWFFTFRLNWKYNFLNLINTQSMWSTVKICTSVF